MAKIENLKQFYSPRVKGWSDGFYEVGVTVTPGREGVSNDLPSQEELDSLVAAGYLFKEEGGAIEEMQVLSRIPSEHSRKIRRGARFVAWQHELNGKTYYFTVEMPY